MSRFQSTLTVTTARTLAAIGIDRDATRSKISDLTAEQETIARRAFGRDFTAGESERMGRLVDGTENARARLRAFDDEARAVILEIARDPRNVEGPVVAEGSKMLNDGPLGQLRSEAQRTIDSLFRSGSLLDHAAEKATDLLVAGTPQDQSIAVRWAATTGDPAYSSAFGRLMADPVRGHLMWTPQEADAFREVERTRAYMSLTDAAGGFMVPLALDPAIILSSAGTNNIMRKVATIKRTVSESWQGVSSAGVSAEWLAENAQAAEATPTLAAVPIPVYKAAAFTPFSYEVAGDAVNFQAELAKVLIDAADVLCATAYTTGPGTTAPTGIVTALLGTGSEINGLGSEVLAATDPYALQNVLPGRFSAGAAFMSHIAIANAYGQMETAAGARTFPELRDGRLLNKPWHENPHMDGVLNAAATENNYVLIYGDFSQYFIVDRIGTTIEIIPNLMGANYRPTGSRGAFLHLRTGGNVSTIAAFRMLDVPTTA